VLGEISKSAVYPKRLVSKDAISGKLLTAVNLGEPFQQRYGYRYIVMHRGDLLNVLLEACRASGRISLENRQTSHRSGRFRRRRAGLLRGWGSL
jgi:3-hydroxybenzoate 6-monooxygenase